MNTHRKEDTPKEITTNKIKTFVLKHLKLFIIVVLVLTASIFYLVKGEENDSTINSETIREEIIPVEKLVTFEYNSTEIIDFSDQCKIGDWNVWFTDNRFIANVDVVTSICVDTSQMSIRESKDITGSKKYIIKVPHSYVYKVTINHSSIKTLEDRSGLLGINPVSPEDVNKLLSDLETKKMKEAETSEHLEESDKRVQEIIMSKIQKLEELYNEHIEYTFEFI